MDKFKIDSHKLLYHVERVAAWKRSGDTYPIYIEISPSGACNHRCRFCAIDYLGYNPTFLKAATMARVLKDMARLGVKSVMFAGEGEPFLNPDCVSMIAAARKSGLDVAVTTNGTLLDRRMLGHILGNLSWLRFSINAGTSETYARMHRAKASDFNKVLRVVRDACVLRAKKKYSCTIGGQILLFKETLDEVEVLAKALSRAGADYLIVKPYSQHPSSVNTMHSPLGEKVLRKLEKIALRYSSGRFRVIVRSQTMEQVADPKKYTQCLGLPFWAYLSSRGDLYACSSFLDDKRFLYGNIYTQSFKGIWNGAKRKRHLALMRKGWDIRKCRAVCRLDKINQYLWDLKHPPEHLNFI